MTESMRPPGQGPKLRLVTVNFWGLTSPLNRRLALAERQLRALQPDVIALQEVKPLAASQSPAALGLLGSREPPGDDGRVYTTAHHLAHILSYRCVYEAALGWRTGTAISAAQEQEGLAILSRYPIATHEVTRLPVARPDEARILLSARVQTPETAVWCHTTHLHYRLDDGLAREQQVVAIDAAIRDIAAREPDGRVHLLCGDFNATPDHDEIRFLRGLTTLANRRAHYQDAFAHLHPDARGVTWCALRGWQRAQRSIDIDRRIDYIFASTRRKDGRGTVWEARVVLDERDSDGLTASDHYGVLADVQVAPNPR